MAAGRSVILQRLADELAETATEELHAAGVSDDRIRLDWSLLMVYPGQTFDVTIPVSGPTDVKEAVTEFHRRNEEARLIEARAQEPIVRGVRLIATGEVEKMAIAEMDHTEDAPLPAGHRRLWVRGEWCGTRPCSTPRFSGPA